MIGDLYNANNVVVGQAAVLFAPDGTTYPTVTDLANSSVLDPFDLTPWTAADPAWTPCGATDQGWSFTANKSTTDVTVEEQSPPVVTTMSSQAVSVDGALSEDISVTLALALNMLKTVHAPTVTDPGYDELTLTDDVIKYSLAMLMANNLGFLRVLEIPTVVQLSNSQTAMRRATAKRMYPASFKSNCATSLIKIINVTAAHS